MRKFTPVRGYLTKYEDDHTPWDHVFQPASKRDSLVRCLKSDKVYRVRSLSEVIAITGMSKAMPRILLAEPQARPWMGYMLRYIPSDDSQVMNWPNYPDHIRALYEQMVRKCNPITATHTTTGVVKHYLGIKYWCRENTLPNDPATICRGMKSGKTEWGDWTISFLDMGAGVRYVELPVPAQMSSPVEMPVTDPS